MIIGLLHAVEKGKVRTKGKSKRSRTLKTKCILQEHCPKGARIRLGQLHAIIVQGNREGKRWYKRIHLECLPLWITYSYNSRRKTRGGDHGGRRPVGTGALGVLTDEAAAERNRLVRARARYLRQFREAWDPETCARLWAAIGSIQKEISDSGVPLQVALQGHRDAQARKEIEEKAERLGLS